MGPQSLTTHPSLAARVHRWTGRWIAPSIALWIALGLVSGLPLHAQGSISATSIPLVLPSAVAFDLAGDLYIAEAGSHVVRKVDSQGHITLFAGTGTQGFSGDSGSASAAQLDSPQGLALTTTKMYIADTHNHRIRAVDLTTNIITTVAGNGSAAFSGDSGAAALAALNLPTALGMDSVGNLYLADTGNHRIRRIAAVTGVISTVAGDGIQGDSGDLGSALSAAIDSPSGLAVDAGGNLYIADTHNHRVRRVAAATGVISTVAGTGALGRHLDGTDAGLTQLALPQGLSIDPAGNVYFADSANHRILRIDARTSSVTLVAGTGAQGYSGDSGAATEAQMDSPRSTGVSPAGLITLADSHNQRIRQISAAPPIISTVAGLSNTSPGALTLSGPGVIAYGTGRLTATLVSATPVAGSITILDTYLSQSSTLASASIAGNSIMVDTSTLAAGIHSLTATFSGDPAHPSAQSPAFVLTVTQAATLTSLALLNAGAPPYTVTTRTVSTTSGNPTGSIKILDAATAIATITSSGATTTVLPTLAAGSHSLTAIYTGDGNFQSSTSGPVTLTVAAQNGPGGDFTLTANAPSDTTIAAGGPASFAFTALTQGTLSSPIALSVSGLPVGATATFNPSYLPPGPASATFTLSIATVKPAIRTSAASLLPSGFFALVLSLVVRMRRGLGWPASISQSLVIFLVCLLPWTITACGNRVRTADAMTSAGVASYLITITGTATSAAGVPIVHTATVNLTLQ